MTAIRRCGAYGADLRPAVEVQTLAGHRDQRTVASDPDVLAKLDRSLQERSGIGQPNELQHLWHISRTQTDRFWIVGPAGVLSDHLHELEGVGHLE